MYHSLWLRDIFIAHHLSMKGSSICSIFLTEWPRKRNVSIVETEAMVDAKKQSI